MLDSTTHYENFPVGSWLVPASLRPALAAIYHFARYADDVADEGNASAAERIAELNRLDQALLALAAEPGMGGPAPAAGSGPGPAGCAAARPHPEALVLALAPHVRKHALGIQPFRRLLSAFRQDVETRRYPDLESLTHYCQRSADPVGELMLALFSSSSGRDLRAAPLLAQSNQICTALQWINFLQDMAIDWEKQRIYLPLDMALRAGLDGQALETTIAQSCRRKGIAPDREGEALRQAIREFHDAAAASMRAGRPLIRAVPLRLSLELRAICAGGQAILEKLARGNFDPFAARPKLSAADLPLLFKLFLKP